ncbi:MAG: VOC family protein [Candidatus Limnocylindrales bacterium]
MSAEQSADPDTDRQGVIPMLAYADGPAAMDWLSRAFGFTERVRWVDEHGVLSHGEMSTDHGLIMLATPTPAYEGPRQHRAHCETAAAWDEVPWLTNGVLVYVDDLATHIERAKGAGARLLSGVESGPGGSLLYRAEDLEGHRWMFMQRATVGSGG